VCCFVFQAQDFGAHNSLFVVVVVLVVVVDISLRLEMKNRRWHDVSSASFNPKAEGS
jgi:hypothetical protein